MNLNVFKDFKTDFPASIVVFFVAGGRCEGPSRRLSGDCA